MRLRFKYLLLENIDDTCWPGCLLLSAHLQPVLLFRIQWLLYFLSCCLNPNLYNCSWLHMQFITVWKVYWLWCIVRHEHKVTRCFCGLPLLASSSTFLIYTSSSFCSLQISWLKGACLPPSDCFRPGSLVGGDWPIRGRREIGRFWGVCTDLLAPGRVAFTFGLEVFTLVLFGEAASSYRERKILILLNKAEVIPWLRHKPVNH